MSTFRRSFLVVLSGLALTAGLVTPAVAAPDVVRSGAVGAAARPGSSQAETQRLTDQYWTAERMAAATPANLVKGEEGVSKERIDAAAKALVAADPAAPAKSDVSTNDAWFSYTNGKVFYRDPTDGLPHECSAAAINSGSKRVVLTAGHCVHPGSGTRWMELWNFVPGYQNGSVPRGRFYAYWFWSSTGWTERADRERDFAFVVTYNNTSGQRVVDAVGGHGLILNPGYGVFAHVAGYPGNRDNAQVQWYCWGTPDRWPSSTMQRMRCDFGPGASGGPWLRDYQQNGLGYAVSNTRGIASDGSGNNSAPYYDNHVGDVFNLAKDMTP